MARLRERLGEDLKDALRAGDTVRRDEIRGVLAALQAEAQVRLTRALDKEGLIPRGDNVELTPEQEQAADRVRASSALSDEDEEGVLQERIKQHRQSIEAFQRGGRADLVVKEEAQVRALEPYLPRQVEGKDLEGEIRAAISEAGATSPRDQGKVMGILSRRLRGQADMKQVSSRVQDVLSAGV